MPKLKLIVITTMFTVFAFFMGLQVSRYGMRSFFTGFIITLLFGLTVFLLQTIYYIMASKKSVGDGSSNIDDYQSPLDIWLIAIPFTVLMILSYVWLQWYMVQIYYCTMFALIGMLLGNGLGRGGKKWSIRKSLPFFFGVIASTLFSLIMDWMI